MSENFAELRYDSITKQSNTNHRISARSHFTTNIRLIAKHIAKEDNHK